jgi:hypothetical protein
VTTSFDLNLLNLYRINGQEMPSMPGLLAMTPPRRTARGRENDRLFAYLALTGNTTFSTAEYMQLTSQLASRFYQAPGSLTSAMRAAAEQLNQELLERNLSTTGRGQYAIGLLVLGAMRGSQLYLLLCGPTHVFWLNQNEKRHIHDPALSGRGLGLSQTVNLYYSQVELHGGDRLLVCGQAPSGWEAALMSDATPVSVDAIRRRLLTLTEGDLNAVLVQAQPGSGQMNLIKPHLPEMRVPDETQQPPATVPLPEVTPNQPAPEPAAGPSEPESEPLPPSAYAVPQQPTYHPPVSPDDFPASIPRASTQTPIPPLEDEAPEIQDMQGGERSSQGPSERTRQTARALVQAMQSWRQMMQNLSARTRNFLPRLLPGVQEDQPLGPPTWVMATIAIAVPLVIATVAFMIFARYGQGPEYQKALLQAQNTREQALSLGDPVQKTEAWKEVLVDVDLAESYYRQTPETQALRQEAQASLDTLTGIFRLKFDPVFNTSLGRSVRITQLAANENNLYMLNGEDGNVLNANITNQGFVQNTGFTCGPGPYEGYQVDKLIDIQPLPITNKLNAELLGIDDKGNLIYCGPHLTPQAIPLPPPDTSWTAVTAFALDGDYLYVLDVGSNAVWVYLGESGAFLERPLFFFGQQVPPLEDVVDLTANGDDLYLLHSDGHLTTCSYSRIDTVPTRCVEPTPLINPFPANQGVNLFAQANFTQILFTSPPDSSVLLLDSDNRSVFRFSPRTLELQGQLQSLSGKNNPLNGSISAMTMSSNHVLYLAINDRVYFSTDVP